MHLRKSPFGCCKDTHKPLTFNEFLRTIAEEGYIAASASRAASFNHLNPPASMNETPELIPPASAQAQFSADPVRYDFDSPFSQTADAMRSLHGIHMPDLNRHPDEAAQDTRNSHAVHNTFVDDAFFDNQPLDSQYQLPSSSSWLENEADSQWGVAAEELPNGQSYNLYGSMEVNRQATEGILNGYVGQDTYTEQPLQGADVPLPPFHWPEFGVDTQLHDPIPEPLHNPTHEPLHNLAPEPLRSPAPEPLCSPAPEPLCSPTPEPLHNTIPEPLYNPYQDGTEPSYVRIETPDGVIYRHATAGAVVKKAIRDKTRWQKLREENQLKYGGCEWGRWGSKMEWDDAYWMVTSKASKSCLEDLLKTERYTSNPPAFKTIRNLYDIIENDLSTFSGPKWNIRQVQLAEAPQDRHILVYRCVQKVGDFLFGAPRFAGRMAYGPIIKFGKDGIRQYDEVNTGDYFNLRQRDLPPGTMLGAGIFMSDATQLSMFSGDVTAHGVYMSLGNIDKEVREDISQGAWVLVAYIPKSNWEKTLASMGPMSDTKRSTLIHLLNRRLFHHCMEAVTLPFRRTQPHEALDPEGNTRLVHYELSIYGADLEEQCAIAAITRNTCPQCDAKGSKLGDAQCQHSRTSQEILQRIEKVLADFHRVNNRYPDPLEFLRDGKKYDLNGVQKPFWRRLPNFDVSAVLSPDVLHGVHKLFFDHIHKWNMNALGAEEYDARLKAQIPVPGERMFPRGVSKLKQLSGKDHRALERVHLALVAHAPSGSNKLTKATRSILECIFLAQLPVQTEASLAAYERAHAEFHKYKEVWIENGSKRSQNTKNKQAPVIKGWAIPKIHIIRHIADHIRWKGTTDNYNTEIMEHLHIPMLKEPYRGSNRRDWLRQVIRWLTRHETMRDYKEWMTWNKGETEKEASAVALNAFEAFDDSDDESYVYTEGKSISGSEDEDGSADETETETEVEAEDEAEGGEHGVWPEGTEYVPATMDYDDQEVEDDIVGGDPQDLPSDNQGPTEQPERWEHTNAAFPVTSTPLHRITQAPAFRGVVIGLLLQELDFPQFVQQIYQHPLFSGHTLNINEGSRINIWTTLRIKVPRTIFYPQELLCRIYSQPGIRGQEVRWDPIFYVPTQTAGVRIPELETLHDYSVGRVALLFAFVPSPQLPDPPLMAYIQRFTTILPMPSGTSGFYAVGKAKYRGSPRYEVIAASQIARLCPLSPIIKGRANHEVIGHQSLDYYQEFYINKFRTPRNFSFVHLL